MMVVVKVVMIVVEMGAGWWVKWVDGLCGSGGGWRGGGLWMVGCGVLGVGGVVGGGGGGGWWGGGWWLVVGVGCWVLGSVVGEWAAALQWWVLVLGGGGLLVPGWVDGGGCWRVVGQGHFFPLLSCQAAFQQPKIRTKKYEFVLLKFVLFCTNPFYKGL